MPSESVSAHNVTLTNCDREAIHIPGAIQPHGLLLGMDGDWVIRYVSANCETQTGWIATELLGQPIACVFTPEIVTTLERTLEGDFDHLNPLSLQLRLKDGTDRPVDGIVHQSSQGVMLLELEPRSSGAHRDLEQFYRLTRTTLVRLQRAGDLEQLQAVLVQEVRKLTGFDRVMLYRFDIDDSGVVIAEAKDDSLGESFLGLHYPATDIPRPARHLYRLNWLRLIPQVAYDPVAILGGDGASLSPDELDLSFSVLRSVSPIHRQYLTNMGVSASMSISLIHQGQLWGLIACHHYRQSRFVPYDLRVACEFLGQVVSVELITQYQQRNLQDKLQVTSQQNQIMQALSRSLDLFATLEQHQTQLMGMLRSGGLVLRQGDQYLCLGHTPDRPSLEELFTWLGGQFQHHLFVTPCLRALYPAAQAWVDCASGILCVCISEVQNVYILWLRPEQVQWVNWAGDPYKQARQEEDGSLTLTPRQSFACWREQVKDQSLPWEDWEIATALELRTAIVGLALQRADELTLINRDLERANQELDAFTYIASHDLKEPLRGIQNYATFLLEDYQDTLDPEGTERLETMVRLTQRMDDLINTLLHFSRLGRQEMRRISVNLNQGIAEAIELLQISQNNPNVQIQIPRPLPTVLGDPILLQEVVINLLGNALKYNNKEQILIEIGCQEMSWLEENAAGERQATFYIRDNGIGISEKHQEIIFRIFKRLHAPQRYGGGTGAGLTIVRKILDRHGGRIWVRSVPQEGSTFFFTLPLDPDRPHPEQTT